MIPFSGINLFCALCVELHLLSEPNSSTLTVLSLDLVPNTRARTHVKIFLSVFLY